MCGNCKRVLEHSTKCSICIVKIACYWLHSIEKNNNLFRVENSVFTFPHLSLFIEFQIHLNKSGVLNKLRIKCISKRQIKPWTLMCNSSLVYWIIYCWQCFFIEFVNKKSSFNRKKESIKMTKKPKIKIGCYWIVLTIKKTNQTNQTFTSINQISHRDISIGFCDFFAH